jgi:hypothetical protein
MQTGYVLESLALEFDTISLPQRQTYGHNHRCEKSDRFQDRSQIRLRNILEQIIINYLPLNLNE